MSNATPLTESNFKDTVANGVTLVDFWAEWCGPCKMIAPILDEIAAEYDGKAAVAKLDIDQAMGIAQQYSVNSIPTLVILKDGEEVRRFIGVTAKAELTKALDEALG